MNKTNQLREPVVCHFGSSSAGRTAILALGDDGAAQDAVAQVLVHTLVECGFRVALIEGVPGPFEGRDAMLRVVFRSLMDEVGPDPVVLGGVSRGARVASTMVRSGDRLVAWAFPFHPRRDPAQRDRVEAFRALDVPVLLVQGTRDAMGNREQIRGYRLPERVKIHWVEDGNHGLMPRASKGHCQRSALESASLALRAFL